MIIEYPNFEEKSIYRKVNVLWGGSKETVARFIEAEMEFEQSRDQTFCDNISGGNLGSLIFNLGHHGRGISDFPNTIDIEISELRRVKIKGKQRTHYRYSTDFPQLFSQIAGAVEKYFHDVYKPKHVLSDHKTDPLEKELRDLRMLIAQSEGKRVVVTLECFDPSEYSIVGLRSDDDRTSVRDISLHI
jgi:hypothetical protein